MLSLTLSVLLALTYFLSDCRLRVVLVMCRRYRCEKEENVDMIATRPKVGWLRPMRGEGDMNAE